jgi:hypothetical protein
MGNLVLRFTMERETRLKVVYGETDIHMSAIGTLYIDRNAIQQMGNPRRIKVTIEPDQENGTA